MSKMSSKQGNSLSENSKGQIPDKVKETEVQEKVQNLDSKEVKKTDDISTKVEAEPAKRKWGTDESDSEEESAKSGSEVERDIDLGGDASGGDSALETPKIKSQRTLPRAPSPPSKKQKKQSAAEKERDGIAHKPPKKSKGRSSKAIKEKAGEGERHVDPAQKGKNMTSSEALEDKDDKEEEMNENPKGKGREKKSTNTTNLKKSPSPKPKRAIKQSAKNPSKKSTDGDDFVISSVAVVNKAGENSGRKCTIMTKAEIEIVFDFATEKLECAWGVLANTLNERSGGTKHAASRLKRHWVLVLRKKVVGGYAD